jgi:hypothetical protein
MIVCAPGVSNWANVSDLNDAVEQRHQPEDRAKVHTCSTPS